MSKLIAIVSGLAMLMMAALPAGASTTVKQDVGVFQGQADIVESATCDNDGNADGNTAAALGLLTTGSYTYTIDAPSSVTSLGRLGELGSLKLCGQLSVNATTLGASCVTTEGSGGKGRAVFSGGDEVYINDLGWPATAGGTFIVTGDVAGTATKVKGTGAKQDLVAVVQALDEGILLDCVNGNAHTFNVIAAYAIV